MTDESPSWQSLEEFVGRRQALDIVLVPSVAGGDVRLRCEFDGYSDFFSIEARDVEYIDISGQFPLGGLLRTAVGDLGELAEKWTYQGRECSGSALVFWDGYAESLEAADEHLLYVVVAGRFDLTLGPDFGR